MEKAGKQQQQGRWQLGLRASDGNKGNSDGDSNSNDVGDGDGNEAGRQQRSQGQGWQGQWQ
jgi:hypothetical protein